MKLELEDFSIKKIASSGQCFRIKNFLELNEVEKKIIGGEGSENIWFVFAFSKILKITQITEKIYDFNTSEEELRDVWKEYFDLNNDYSKINRKILTANDPYLIKALEFSYGIRILKQDLWEIIVSFLISQQNNITKIKNSIFRLCASYSKNLSFPSPEFLATCDDEIFKRASLGYRAEYIKEISKAYLQKKLDFEILKSMDYVDALKYLKNFKGIGDKIANCIILFGLHKLNAFPKDVWINRIIKDVYNGDFNEEIFEDFAGIVQQYMFFYERLRR